MKSKKRNGFQVMLGLIGMVKPLIGYMALAIILGTIGHLMAIFITVLGAYGLLNVLGMYDEVAPSIILIFIVVCAVLRGVFRYGEQLSNHFIAFKLLARIRSKLYSALKKLAPAKLEGEEKGNLISIITSDIELLEVFYAHTISPIAIAFLVTIIMTTILFRFHILIGIIGLFFYGIVGVIISLLNGKRGGTSGLEYRTIFGQLNTIVLDNMYGMNEILQFGQQEKRFSSMNKKTEDLEAISEELKVGENKQRITTDLIILFAGVVMLFVSGALYVNGALNFIEVFVSVVLMMSSFGPVAALSALSNNLHHTLASGNRVLDLLEEEPQVSENSIGEFVTSGDITLEEVGFSYPNGEKQILDSFTKTFKEKRIYGILGESGCGKSTLLKLMMRFFETTRGSVKYHGINVNEIETNSLRNHISYVTQETFLFQDTIENNIKIGKQEATREEVEDAAKMASIHEFIVNLPYGYDTLVTELGGSLSGGEKQRIGLARAFLHDGKILLLDEPTSNIDSLNESIILRSLENVKDKTIILVSHRKSTMGIVDEVVKMRKV